MPTTKSPPREKKGNGLPAQIERLKKRVLTHHGRFLTSYTKALTAHVKPAGDALNELEKLVREQLGRGEWERWCKKHLPEMSKETINVYRRIARNWDKLKEQGLTNGTLRQMRSALSASKPKQPNGNSNGKGGLRLHKGEDDEQTAEPTPTPRPKPKPVDADDPPSEDLVPALKLTPAEHKEFNDLVNDLLNRFEATTTVEVVFAALKYAKEHAKCLTNGHGGS